MANSNRGTRFEIVVFQLDLLKIKCPQSEIKKVKQEQKATQCG